MNSSLMGAETLAPRVSVINRKHIKKYSKQILDDAGEGVILRNASSLYERGRSSNLIKFKVITLYYSINIKYE